MSSDRAIPMFPLGTVLFPHAFLPLNVFEPRYRQMTQECLAGDRRFGVVLIERGSEVGGGDVRFDLGTMAAIVEAAELPDGRWLLAAVGLHRIRVSRWLLDDPYPQAEVEELVDGPSGPAGRELRDRVEALLRRTLALKIELGEAAAAATVELDADPTVASYQAAILAPIGPVDALGLLRHDRADERLGALADLLGEEEAVLARRLSGD